jgi:hypothetical protein
VDREHEGSRARDEVRRDRQGSVRHGIAVHVAGVRGVERRFQAAEASFPDRVRVDERRREAAIAEALDAPAEVGGNRSGNVRHHRQQREIAADGA